MTTAMAAAWLDITPEVEAEFADWYFREHIPERVTLPGFLSGRRYTAPGGGPNKYLALYEATSKDVFGSEAYRERLNQPTWEASMAAPLPPSATPPGAMSLSGLRVKPCRR